MRYPIERGIRVGFWVGFGLEFPFSFSDARRDIFSFYRLSIPNAQYRRSCYATSLFVPNYLYIHFSFGAIWKERACEGEDETRRRYGTFLLLLLAITGVDSLFWVPQFFFWLTIHTYRSESFSLPPLFSFVCYGYYIQNGGTVVENNEINFLMQREVLGLEWFFFLLVAPMPSRQCSQVWVPGVWSTETLDHLG